MKAMSGRELVRLFLALSKERQQKVVRYLRDQAELMTIDAAKRAVDNPPHVFDFMKKQADRARQTKGV